MWMRRTSCTRWRGHTARRSQMVEHPQRGAKVQFICRLNCRVRSGRGDAYRSADANTASVFCPCAFSATRISAVVESSANGSPAMSRLSAFRAACASLVLIVSAGTARGQSPAALTPFQFLLGQWEGVGDQAGATGGFTFAPGVQDRVIVRTNYSNTPASVGSRGSAHDRGDLRAARGQGRVFVSESHVIRYVAEPGPARWCS